MNTTRLAIFALLLVGCAAESTAETTSAATTSLVGAWSIHMVPEDRVSTTIPPACDGSMTVGSDDATGLAGTWSCGAGIGQLSGFRVHESGGAWIGFGIDGDRWLTAWVKIVSPTNLTGDQLSATR